MGCFFLGLGLPPFWRRRAEGRKEGRVENRLHKKCFNSHQNFFFAIECSLMWGCVCPRGLTVAAEAAPRLKTTATRIFRLSMAAQRGSSSAAANIYIWHLSARTWQAYMFAKLDNLTSRPGGDLLNMWLDTHGWPPGHLWAEYFCFNPLKMKASEFFIIRSIK